MHWWGISKADYATYWNSIKHYYSETKLIGTRTRTTSSFSFCNKSEALVQHSETTGFRVAILPLRRQFVQPAHFEHLVTGGSVEAGVGGNIRHGVGHGFCVLRGNFALVHRGLLLWHQQVPLVQSHLGHNASALVHSGVFILVQVADKRRRRRHFLFGYLRPNCLFSVGTLLELTVSSF